MPTTYGAGPQGYAAQPQPGVYGQPAGAQYGGGQPSQPHGGPTGQQGYGTGGQQGGSAGQSYGQPSYQPSPLPQPDPRQRDPRAGGSTGGWPQVEKGEQAPKSRKGMTIGLIVLAILVVVGVGGYVGLKLATRADVYTVGQCVRQDGAAAAVVDCGTAGAYKITQIVDTEGQCTDATQPSLLLTGGDKSRVACLGPPNS